MFATHGQENVVHARQAAAAGKPLNQGIRSLNPRTPGHIKTPFRTIAHDENHVFATQGKKTIAKDGPGKLAANAFVTPAAHTSRAPLGAKTTNAKAQLLKPSALGQTVKQEKSTRKLSTTRRSARKINVAPTDAVQSTIKQQQIEEDEPDYGYAPPPIVELPDPPLEFGYNQDFPQFKPENMFRGYGEIYFGSPKDEHGISLRLKMEEAEAKKAQEEQEKEFLESIVKQHSTRPDPDAEVDAMIAAGPKKTAKLPIHNSSVSTIKAKSAVAALSQSSSKLPSAALKQTISSMQKSNLGQRGMLSATIQAKSAGPLSVSKNTIGFPRAKKAPSIIPKAQQPDSKQNTSKPARVDQDDIHPADFVRLYGQPPMDSEMWFRLKQYELLEQDSNGIFDDGGIFPDDELSGIDLFSHDLDSLEDTDFQLSMPEE